MESVIIWDIIWIVAKELGNVPIVLQSRKPQQVMRKKIKPRKNIITESLKKLNFELKVNSQYCLELRYYTIIQ